ncbi:hypothetical protein [Curtobacterium sp. MCBA15_008]|uniref:hypothetical protein n=1 Tax=Curtobacterium sp. MCBA15_008 TaxID=1898736 RepID=UPI0008DD15CA|nr:hypothetical protein [Curtobacterium sp. MCBA15_008]OII05283.1 hypothetical protein BIU96_06380 [Curtobacterium sp. MCBA15_008]
MDWWNDLTDWISSDDGWRVISGAIIPFVAIVVAGVIAALIGRGATKRVVAMQEREARNAAVAGIVSAARKAAAWGSLGHDERAYADHLAEDADIRLRLLPVTGAPLAANWTQHEIADIKKNSSTFSFQAEQSLAEFRERLLEWQARPSKARKLFKSDLERWKFDSPDPDAELIKRQQDWNADQNGGARPAGSATETAAAAPATERPTPTTTSLRPAAQRPGGTPSSATSAPSGSATTTAGGVPTASSAAGAAGAAGQASSPSATGTAGATGTASAPAGSAAARAAGAGFSVTRGGSTQADPNATTPISDTTATNATTPITDADATRSYGDGATRSYGDGATRSYGDSTPVRPTLGSPVSPARSASSGMPTSSRTRNDTDDVDVVDDARDARGSSGAGGTGDTGGASSSRPASAPAGSSTPSPVAQPTSADAHVNRSSDGDGGADPRTPNTTSVPTRIADAPSEPTDANETSEAPYTQPISASELRRRAADDDE